MNATTMPTTAYYERYYNAYNSLYYERYYVSTLQQPTPRYRHYESAPTTPTRQQQLTTAYTYNSLHRNTVNHSGATSQRYTDSPYNTATPTAYTATPLTTPPTTANAALHRPTAYNSQHRATPTAFQRCRNPTTSLSAPQLAGITSAPTS